MSNHMAKNKDCQPTIAEKIKASVLMGGELPVCTVIIIIRKSNYKEIERSPNAKR